MKLYFESKKRMCEELSSLNDFLDELKNGCGTKKEADALYRKAKETLGKGDFGLFEKEYAQTRNRLSESKKRMNEDRKELASRIRKGQLRHGNSLADNQNDADEVKAADEYDPQFGFEWDEDEDTKIQFQDKQMNTHVLRKDNNKLEKRPRVSSNTWGRIWSKGELEKQFEGPKNIVRQDMAKYLDDTANEIEFNESLNLNDYADCWVECRDGEPLFCYDSYRDASNGIVYDGLGDYYNRNGEVHEYTLKRWEGGKLYDVDSKTGEVIYEEKIKGNNSMKLVFENKKRMNEDFHDGYNYVTKCSFDFANNGKYEEDWIRDHIDKVMDQMGCDWSGYLEFENVTEAYK